MRFGALLSQNLRKGTKGLNDLLRLEAIQSFEERKARARRLGEEAGTKLLLPMFLMLALGCLLRIGGLLDRGALERLNNVCFKVFLSLLLYYNIYTADVADVFNPRLLGFALLLQMAIWGILFLTVPRFEKSDKRRGAMIQGIGRTNFVIFGTAIGTALCGEGNIGPISLLVAAVVPFYNVLAVIVLEIFRGGRVPVRTC